MDDPTNTEEKPNEQEAPKEEIKKAKKGLFAKAILGFEPPEGGEGEPTIPTDEKPKEEEEKPKEEKVEPTSEEKPKEKPEKKKKDEPSPFEFKGEDVKVQRRQPAEKKDPPTKEPQLSKEDVRQIFEDSQKPKEEKPDDSALPESIREEIFTWEYGEQKGLAQKGTAKKLRANFTARSKMIERLQRENGDDPDYEVTQDPVYKRWVKQNDMNLSAAQKRKIERQQWKDEAIAEARGEINKDLSQKVERLESELRETKVRPEIEKKVDNYRTGLAESLKGDETATNIASKWGEEAYKEGFAPQIEKTQAESNVLASELLEIRKGLKAHDPNNSRHQWIAKLLDHESQKIMGDATKAVRNGKKFIHPFDRNATEDGWTLSTDDMLNLLKANTQRNVAKKIQAEDERLERLFSKRNGTPNGKQAGQDDDTDLGKDTSTRSRPAGSAEKPSAEKKGVFARRFGQ